MLELELGGKSVTTMNEKQEIKINGNVVEIERVGDSIYVNQQAINLIVVDEKNKWKSVLKIGVVFAAVAGVLYLVNANFELVAQGFSTATEFVQTSVIPVVGDAVDGVTELIDGNEADTSPSQ